MTISCRMRWAIPVLIVVAATAAWLLASHGTPAAPAYAGAQACVPCHQVQFDAWQGSHHDLAMQHANAKSALGDFNNTRFQYNGVTSTFFKRGERFYVNTDGPDGALQDFEIKYTFGVDPLQQYLVELPGGRMQALSIAWDSRPMADGGQRWFHLYPREKIDRKDELHWTKLSHNWNHMCAECHSTHLQKNFDLAGNQFRTTWAEINVACESCHGPASRHIDWAGKSFGAGNDAHKGLVIQLDERQGVSWAATGKADTAVRNRPRTTSKEIDTCARCHSRRSSLTEAYQHGRALMDTHLPALLTEHLYHADGQIKEEDYEYASFLQSKMYHNGVTCSDCHEPHSLKLRAPGNQVCLQCHNTDKYNSPQHHFHPLQSQGASCAECHMPATTYMLVDPRHDHSIRIPRPDLSITLNTPNTPNACNQCHTDKSASWANAHMQQWYGKDWSPGWHFGETLFEARQGLPQVGRDLMAVALAPQLPDIARATATALLPDYLDATTGVIVPKLLADKSPLVRREALGIVDHLPAEQRWKLAGKLLTDPVLAVRIEAARVLAVVPRATLTPEQHARLDNAVHEYITAAQSNAEHPQSHVNLGLLYQALAQHGKAVRAYQQALQLDAGYVVAYINLADLYRALQQEANAEATLLKARAAAGNDAAIEHALGLHYVRSRQMPKALASLAKAVELQPGNARYGYVYAVALHSQGESRRALQLLEQVHARHPHDRDVLIALVSMNQAMGDVNKAMSYAGKLVEMDPRYGSVEQVMQQISPQ